MLLRLRGSRENVTPFGLLTMVALCPSAHNQSQFHAFSLPIRNHSLVISHARSPGIVAAIMSKIGRKGRTFVAIREMGKFGGAITSLVYAAESGVGAGCTWNNVGPALSQATE